MSKSTSRCRHYRVYAVQRRRSPRAHWMHIGAATTHRDGRGFDLELQTIPFTAEELVIRTAVEHILPNGMIAKESAARRRLPAKTNRGSTALDSPLHSQACC